MFGLLKNKIKNFTDKILGKAKDKIEEEAIEETPVEETEETKETKETEKTEESPVEETEESPVEETEETPVEETEETPVEETEESLVEETKETEETEETEESQIVKKNFGEKKEEPIEKASGKKKEEPIEEEKPKQKTSFFNLFKSKPKPPKETIEKPLPSKKEEVDDLTIKKSEDIKKSFVTSVKSIFTSKIKFTEKELSDFLEEFELSLLEADVSIFSAETISKDLKEKLVSVSFSKDNPLEDIKKHIRDSLSSQLAIDCDINNYIEKTKKENQPFIIMFIGPNGAGKTTTISKFAYLYKNQNKSIILASGDTFRAGSIDQLEKHANAIGVRIIKQNYGSDPAAVAFDAVTSAKANKADYVLIDTAGRQENNINLMQELKKIKKVVSPNLTIYIGEAQAGQAIVDQINGFDKEIHIDGVILTKIDTDPKGGVAISILNELKKPIFYVGTGQTYNDLEAFSSQYIIDRIVV